MHSDDDVPHEQHKKRESGQAQHETAMKQTTLSGFYRVFMHFTVLDRVLSKLLRTRFCMRDFPILNHQEKHWTAAGTAVDLIKANRV